MIKQLDLAAASQSNWELVPSCSNSLVRQKNPPQIGRDEIFSILADRQPPGMYRKLGGF